MSKNFRNLAALEAESIYMLRELACEFERPLMMYSIGKDSSVLLHLAYKAFYPGRIPFPLLHIDTGWKFQEMISHRQKMATKYNFDLLIHTNAQGKKQNINPFDYGSKIYTDVMKTQALRQALDKYEADCAIGGARRDEERSRAKERVWSHRNKQHRWDPRNQRPEPWQKLNSKLSLGDSIRAFPLSNWTELDIWHYIKQEDIAIVDLYFAKHRPVVRRKNTWIMKDDDRMRLYADEELAIKQVRFRTLGCYPLTGAIESTATTVDDLIMEMKASQYSERQGRLIDDDEDSSMEKKKLEGYF